MATYPNLAVVCDAVCKVNGKIKSRFLPQLGKCASAYLLVTPTGKVIFQSSSYLGELTIHEAEYSAVVLGLNKAIEFCRESVSVWTDSALVVGQMNGLYVIRKEKLKLLYDTVQIAARRFVQPVSYFHHSRGSYWARRADKLANAEYVKYQAG